MTSPDDAYANAGRLSNANRELEAATRAYEAKFGDDRIPTESTEDLKG
jgi:hypothetical protein